MKLVSLALISISAYSAPLMTGSITTNGVYLTYETRLEPGTPPIRKHGGGTLTENNLIKRHLCNFENNTYFGYDLTVEPLGDRRYRLVFAPLTITPQKMTEIFKSVASWTPLALPKGPATMEVRGGETVALDLFVHPSTGQKVTDYLTIKGSQRRHTPIAGPARDFSPEDATIEISSPHVSVDGNAVTSSNGGSISGPAVWIDLPGHGRFVFSLAPRPDLGMDRAGEIRGTTMTWRAGGHGYTITTDKPIVSGSRAYNLYVVHIPRPADNFGMSAGTKPDEAVRRR